MTTDSTATTQCRIPRVVGYAAIVIAGAVIGSTVLGWAIIAMTTILRD